MMSIRLFHKLLVLIAVILSFGQPARAQDREELTLPLAVDIALRTNPLIRATTSGRVIAESQLSEARAARMPLLQIGQTMVRSNNPVFVFGTLLEQGRFGPNNFAIDSLNGPGSLTNFRSSINFRFPLFDQLQSGTRIAQARISQKQATAQQKLVEQQIRFEVIQAYYGVLVAEARKSVADEAVLMAEADTERIQSLFDNGMIVASDLLAMRVQLAEYRQQQIQARGDINTAYAALNVALGLPIDTPQKIAGRLTDRPFDLPAQEKLMESALLHRPDYGQSLMAVESREKEVRGTAGQYLPRVDLFGSFGNSGNRLFNGSSDYTVGVSITFNLFDRGRQARIQQARAERDAADAEREHKADLIRLDVVRAYQNYLAAKERVNVAADAIKQAVETLRIVQDRHQAGLTTITEVLRSQTALVRTKMGLLGARYDYYVGYAQTLLVCGQLEDISPFSN
jgi:outer membrane protein